MATTDNINEAARDEHGRPIMVLAKDPWWESDKASKYQGTKSNFVFDTLGAGRFEPHMRWRYVKDKDNTPVKDFAYKEPSPACKHIKRFISMLEIAGFEVHIWYSPEPDEMSITAVNSYYVVTAQTKGWFTVDGKLVEKESERQLLPTIDNEGNKIKFELDILLDIVGYVVDERDYYKRHYIPNSRKQPGKAKKDPFRSSAAELLADDPRLRPVIRLMQPELAHKPRKWARMDERAATAASRKKKVNKQLSDQVIEGKQAMQEIYEYDFQHLSEDEFIAEHGKNTYLRMQKAKTKGD